MNHLYIGIAKITRLCKLYLLVCIISIIIFGCTNLRPDNSEQISTSINCTNIKQFTPIEFIDWVKDVDNGLKVEKTIDRFTYTAQYKPWEYLAIQELKKSEVTRSELLSKVGEVCDLQYFTFRISPANQYTELLKIDLKSENEYYNRIEYFSFKMQQDLKLIENGQMLNCILFHFERVYNIATYCTFSLGFPLIDSNNTDRDQDLNFRDKTLIYDEKVFNTGKIKLTIKAEDLSRIPGIITI